MNFKVVIFDLDGTLIDTIADIASAANSALANNNMPTHTVEDYVKMVGGGLRTLIEVALPTDKTEALVDKCTHEIIEAYHKKPVKHTIPYSGVVDLLSKLHGKLKLAILSNKHHDLTTRIVKEVLPSEKFDVIRGLIPGTPKKPDPTSAFELCEQLGCKPEEVLYVGDSDVDMQTAVNAGFYPVGVDWGFRSAEVIKAHGAKKVISTPADLLKILGL